MQEWRLLQQFGCTLGQGWLIAQAHAGCADRLVAQAVSGAPGRVVRQRTRREQTQLTCIRPSLTRSSAAFSASFSTRPASRCPRRRRRWCADACPSACSIATCNSYTEYFRLLSSGQDPAEVQTAIDLLTTNETYFFREPKHFELLREQASAARNSGKPFRVWSAASSSGEEAYSIAMVLADCLEGSPWEVVGSDLSSRVLQQARLGHYSTARTKHIPQPYLQRFCLKGTGAQDGTLLIDRALRARVQFLQVNLNTRAAALGSFDVIFLRNVMIYFNDADQAAGGGARAVDAQAGRVFLHRAFRIPQRHQRCRAVLRTFHLPKTLSRPTHETYHGDGGGRLGRGSPGDDGPAEGGPRHRSHRRRRRSAHRHRTDEAAVAGCHRAGHRDAAHGWHHVPEEDHARASDAGHHLLDADRSGRENHIEALSAGAVTIITKPKLGLKQFLNETSDDLITAVRVASRANVKRLAARVVRPPPAVAKNTADVILGRPAIAQ